MKRILSFLSILFAFALVAQGQQRLITGTVTDFQENLTLPGVSVVVKDTGRGTITNAQGQYEIMASPGEVLVFSFVGMITEEIMIEERDILNVVLIQDIAFLDEVVVTALGISREAKALGYSVTTVSGDQISQTGEVNPISSLAGKVAGLDITETTAGPSGSRRVVIRGISEIMGNNQPLYVIDGVPVENTSLGQATEWGGFDLGDGTADLNPEDIESISVLKGPSASALYGSRALNGVILITTKSGSTARPGMGIEFTSTTTFDVVSTKLNEYQTTYGQGSNGLLPRSGQMANNVTSAWGPRLNPDSLILQRDGELRPYTLVKDNIQGFFDVGTTTQNTISITQNAENASMRFSYGNVYNNDIVPGSGLVRNNFSLRGTSSIADFIQLDSRVAYTTERVNNRPAMADAVNNIGNGLVGLAPNVDQAWLQTYADEEGNYIDYTGNQYRANPYWTLNRTRNRSSRDRITGFISANINLFKGLNLRVRSGIDQYNFEIYNFYDLHTPTRTGGQLAENSYRVREMNHEALLIYDTNLSDDLTFSASFGGNIMQSKTEITDILSTEINAPGKISMINFQNSSTTPSLYRKEIHSLYGYLQWGYRSFLFLDVTGRNDWSSTLPMDNNSFFYPSVSASVVPTEVIDFNLPWLTFAKLRGSWAQVGGDTDPYKLHLTYSMYGRSHLGYPLGSITGNLLPNMNLLPQTATSYELGTDLRFFNNRMALDFTYFNQSTTDQILQVQTPEVMGFQNAIINSGDIRNTGVELLLSGRPVQTSDFSWDVSVNFSKINNEVIKLADDYDVITIADARWAGVRIVAREGSEFGIIQGRGFKRDPHGNIIHENGLPTFTDEPVELGSILPDWTGGIHNTFSYKGITVRASIDFRIGGDIYSITNRQMYLGGTHAKTEAGREAFNDWAYRNEMQRIDWIEGGNAADDYEQLPMDGGFIGKGVMIVGYDENDNPIYEENDVFVNPQQYWQHYATDVGEGNIYDASYIKLRDLSIGYTLPRRLLGNLPVESITVSAVGRNLFILHKNVPNIDPESSYNNSNGQGLEYGSLPTRRHYGFNLNVKF